MTRIFSTVLALCVGAGIMFGAFDLGRNLARGDGGGALLDSVGSGSAMSPADRLHDPIAYPFQAIDDARGAWKNGWAFGILATIVILTHGLASAVGRWPNSRLLKWFAQNKTAIFVVSGIGTVAGASFNALALGGTWLAALFAGVAAILAVIKPTPHTPGAAAPSS